MATDSSQSWEDHVAAIQAGTDKAVVDAAILALQPLIEQTADRVCRHTMVSKQVRLDLVAESVAYVLIDPREKGEKSGKPRIADYNLQQGAFSNWLKTVLVNRLKDNLRASRRRRARWQTMVVQEGEPGVAEKIPDPRPYRPGEDLERSSPFSDRDFDQITAWRVEDRILVLVVFELCRKIPVEVWSEWCSEAGLPTPFPPNPEDRFERSEWIRLIADLTSDSEARLKMRLTRRLKNLKKEPLDYIRELSNGK